MLVPARSRQGLAKIAIKSVGHRYSNDVAALHDVNLDILSGEFVCLLGPSGCGKTTLLYTLAGAIHPSGGHIRIDGREVKGPSPDRLLMFQEPALFPWLTVRQNISFALRSRKLSRRQANERAMTFIRQVQLEGFEDTLPHELSGGMRMRASLARALAMDPAVLLMDEPFAPLDAVTRAHMHTLLQSIWMKSRKTVVFVTHNVREALVLGDRVVVMAPRPGRIIQDLEVHLPRPRDPDDERVVTLSRHIRAALRRSEVPVDGMSGMDEQQGETAHGGPDRRPSGRVLPGAAAPLGGPL